MAVPIAPTEVPMIAPGLPPHALPPRTRGPVERVLQHARHRAVVFGRDDQQAVGIGDLLLECARDFGKVAVVVLAVQRQAADIDEVEGKSLGASDASACASCLLNESRRRLPTTTAIFKAMTFPREWLKR